MSVQQQKPYRYFDTPDGQDTFKKLWCVLKPTSLVALGISTCDVMLYSHPKGYLQTLGRYAYVGLPIVGVSTAFVCTTNLVASLRHKDDKINWFLGGFAAGSVFGVWSRRTIVGFNMGMVLGIFAIVKKTAVENGWALHPAEFKTMHRGAWAATPDFTLTAERPRNWTTTKP